MNNLYHKIAVASVCTALGFALGVNKEAKAATFTLRTDMSNNGFSFFVLDRNQDGMGDYIYGGERLPVGTIRGEEYRAVYEFNIAALSLASNTVISSAIFQGRRSLGLFYPMSLFGYIGNGQPDFSDFQPEGLNLGSLRDESQIISSNVTPFIQQIISNNNAFAGFNVRGYPRSGTEVYEEASLTITTVDVSEPVPEPTTIFGSAIGLCLGGWLKRKKSTPQNKVKSQA